MSGKNHFETLLALLEIERQAEREENKRELERYPLHVREARGKTATKLNIIGDDVGVGNMPLLILSPSQRTGDLSPFHAMNQGDNVLLSFAEGSGLEPIDGTLYDVKDLTVTVALNASMPDPIPDGLCQIDLLGSDATYRRMREAVLTIKKTKVKSLLAIRDIIAGQRQPDGGSLSELSFFNTGLNAFQQEAVQKALAAEEVALIHGPPGTGKTTVLVEIILQAIKNGKKVLAAAPSNIAVDNIVEKLLPSGVRMVRLGHPARILEPLRHATLSAQLEDHPFMSEIRSMESERQRLQKQLKRKEDRGDGGNYNEIWKMRGQIKKLWKDSRFMEQALRKEIVSNAQIVLATHAGLTRMASKMHYDVVILDEASQATEPLSWVSIICGKKVILAGDHCQLPPTLYSQDAVKQGLDITIFDQLKRSLPETSQAMLRVQYRMNEKIMNFSSKEFYEDKLMADASVQSHVAMELKGVKKSDLTSVPLVYVDTAGTGYEESWNELLESRENEGEAQLLQQIWGALKAQGIKAKDTAVLTPYGAQVKRIKKMNLAKGLEVGSVDSFQGREKEIILLSLVRSNNNGEVGFLGDTRRMNVAMTRARRLLIVIGDSATISHHEFYRDFLDYVEKNKAHRSAWEWIS